MKLAIVGSRGYPHPEMVEAFVSDVLRKRPSTIIVSGGCRRGPDRWAEDTARSLGHFPEIYDADWDRYGKGAGMIRNPKIAQACDRMVAFYDGASNGTLDVMARAHAANKPILVIGPDGKPMSLPEEAKTKYARPVATDEVDELQRVFADT